MFYHVNGGEEQINAEFLHKLFQNKIDSIVGTVKDKLYEDAKKEELIEEVVTYLTDTNAGTQDLQSQQR